MAVAAGPCQAGKKVGDRNAVESVCWNLKLSTCLAIPITFDMNGSTILIAILTIAYIAGGCWSNIWVTKHWADRPSKNFVILVTAPACIISLFTAALLSMVAYPFVAVAQSYRERKFAAAMKERGRFKAWDEIQSMPDEGTVIIEQAQKDGYRVWWTPEDVIRASPHPIPIEDELDYLRISEPLPFVRWCAEIYTSTDKGRALLTEFPFPISPGIITTDFLRSKAPIANVISTVKIT